ncbi:hypothetical protein METBISCDRAFT_2482, partial [Metschnikowia bicuspidata]
ATYFVAPDSPVVYVYGGTCSSGFISSRLLSFDMDTLTFYNVTTTTRTQPFYGAVSMWAPKPQSSVVVGGKSPAGWLNMYQLATWSFQSRWLFQEAAKDENSTVDSRCSPLVLPVFTYTEVSSAAEFLSSYSPTSALIVGGEGDG